MKARQKPEVTPEMIEKLAGVAGLDVPASRLGGLTARYVGFVEDMERLKELDVTAEEPAITFSAIEVEK